MHPAGTKVLHHPLQIVNGSGVAPVHTRQVDEIQFRIYCGPASAPSAVRLDAKNLAVDAERFGRVGGGSIQTPNMRRAPLDETRLSQPFANASFLSPTGRSHQGMRQALLAAGLGNVFQRPERAVRAMTSSSASEAGGASP